MPDIETEIGIPSLRKPSLVEALYILRKQGYLGLGVAEAILVVYRELNQPAPASQEESLIELEPHWAVANYITPTDTTTTGRMEMHGTGRHGMGLTFLCPVHRDHRLSVLFANPVDNGPQATPEEGRYYWRRQGETFNDLTLGPSIDASGNTHGIGHIETPCWHGFITNGEIK